MNNEKLKVAYVAELDQDVDDIIAVQYLYDEGILDYVVLDPFPTQHDGKERMQILFDMGITVKRSIQPGTKTVFVGGPLTEVARYLRRNKLDNIVMNGGFVGCNIRENPIPKFKGKETVRTFNFNVDVDATDYVLKTSTDKVGQIILVGKNVCHDMRNSGTGLWSSEYYLNIFDKYNSNETKLQHDMLACREGIKILTGNADETYCEFEELYPFNDGLQKNMTKWGSKREPTEYRKVLAAVKYRKA